MEVTVIHGQAHKGSTYHATQEVVRQLSAEGTAIIHEFFLPKDGPDFCIGCFTCIMQDENGCPHREKTQQIMEAIERSDVIIVGSPTYGFEMTGQLKTLFDHLCYAWLSHRPRQSMFCKTGVVVTTAAGTGMKRAARSIANQLFWLGIPRHLLLPVAVNAASWETVSPNIKLRIKKKAAKLARKVNKPPKVGVRLRFMFEVMRAMQKSNHWNELDRTYWQQNGWLGNERPWKTQ